MALVIPGGITTHTAGSGTNNNTCTVPTSTDTGHVLIFCFWTLNGAVLTSFGSGGTNAWTTLDTATNTIFAGVAYKVVSAGDPTTYTPTWSGASGGSQGILIDIPLCTDGSTPVIDVHAITAGFAQPSITTTVNADQFLVIFMNNGVLGNPATSYFSRILNDAAGPGTGSHAIYMAGQEVAGTPSIITFTPSSGNATITAAIAFKSNTTTSAMFVGVGNEVDPGACTSVVPGVPSNAITGDTLIAGIVEKGTTGVVITPPAGWALLGSKADPSQTIQLSLYWHTVVGGDPSSWTFTFASSIPIPAGIIIAFANLDAITPFDVVEMLGIAAMDVPARPSVTPTPNDELVMNFITQGGNGSFTVASLMTPLRYPGFGGSGIISAGYGFLTSAGAEAAIGAQDGNAFASATIGLKAATAPTRSTSNMRVNQTSLVIMNDTAAPLPPVPEVNQTVLIINT